MIKSKRLLSFLILSTALTFSACSGGGDNIEQVNNVENNSTTSQAEGPAPDKTIKARGGKTVNYDNLAQTFLLEDMRDIYAVTQGFDEEFKPSILCFNYWHKRDGNKLTNEQKNDCQLWVQEVADLYTSYGYMAKPDMFKSELLWATLRNYGVEEYTKAYKAAKDNKTVPPNCSTRPQIDYKTPELIEDGKKFFECKPFEIK